MLFRSWTPELKKDHLGSVKMTVDVNGTAQAWNDYYPYGMSMGGNRHVVASADPRYNFTGKERDVETATTTSQGLDYFGARYYDSWRGQWLQVDPLTNKYPGMSPFNYCGNNPVIFIDPNGMEWANEDDKSEAQKMMERILKRQQEIEKKRSDLQSEILASIMDADKAKKLQEKMDDLDLQLADVKSAQSEITALGDDKNNVFTFNSISASSNEGGTTVNQKGQISINYVYGDFSNEVHELKHAAQIQQGLIQRRGTDLFLKGITQLSSEVQAYQRQFSVTGKLPYSDIGSPKNFNSVNSNYVKGIYYQIGLSDYKVHPYKDFK